MNDDKSDETENLKSETVSNESEIEEDHVVIRKKPNLFYAKAAGYAIPLVVVAIAIFWVIPVINYLTISLSGVSLMVYC